LLDGTIHIPTLPAIAIKILDAVTDDQVSLEQFSKVVASDPAIAAKTLKVANSSFYGLRSTVSSLKQAVSILGLNTLKNLALSFVIVDSMKGLEKTGFDLEFFWKRAVTAAVAASLLTKYLKQSPDEAFVTGLLQDIGVVILQTGRQEEYSLLLEEKAVTGISLFALEKRNFGFDHQDVGSVVLSTWGLPSSIVEPIRYHHHAEEAPQEYRLGAQLVELSGMISALYHSVPEEAVYQGIGEILNSRYGIQKDASRDILDAVARESNEMISFFDLSGKELMPISHILQEANEALSTLNISHEQLAMQLRQEKEKSEIFARTLKATNDKLREMAFRDELTGLFNQRYFLSALNTELKRSERYRRHFSIILLDIDSFKAINDAYGHRSGDTVIKILGDALVKVMRSTDIVARYGGDEFAILCPETGQEGAAVSAERLRRAIEQLTISLQGKSVRVTVSAGVSEYVPGGPPVTSSHIFEAADKALYQSKRKGRNYVSLSGVGVSGNNDQERYVS